MNTPNPSGQYATLALLGPIAWYDAPPWILRPVLAGCVAGLAHLGRPIDRPIVSAALVTGRP